MNVFDRYLLPKDNGLRRRFEIDVSLYYYRKVLVLKGKIDNKKRHQQRCLKNIIFFEVKIVNLHH